MKLSPKKQRRLLLADSRLTGGRIHNAETMAGFTAADRRNMTGSRVQDGKSPFTTSPGRFRLECKIERPMG